MNIYESVTNRILGQLEAGIIPWRKEWKSTGAGALPSNFTTEKPYRGVNVWLLMGAPYGDNRWLTYKQAQSIGAQVRRGEKGTPIVFWSTFEGERENAKGETVESRIPFARTYTVFNVEQCDGITAELPLDRPAFEPIPAAQALADSYLTREYIALKHGGNRAFYSVMLDYVQMPHAADFSSPDAYYSTLFHEMGHSTGHASRLDRGFEKGAVFGSADYSKEELIAEFTAAFLCAETGISNAQVETNQAAYIQGWMRALKNEKTLLIAAAQRAQRAADRVLDRAQVARESEAIAA
jgi:antirestriction protein ArdC